MAALTEEPELIFSSKTQTAEQMTNLLSEDGYDRFESDAPVEQPTEPVEEVPTEQVLPTPSETGEVAGEPDGGNPPAQESGKPTEPKKKTGSQREKEKAERLAAENAELKRQLEDARRTPATPPVPPPTPAAAIPPAPQATVPAAVEDPEPQESDERFDGDYAAYLKEATRWAARDEHRRIQERATLAEKSARERTEREAAEAQRHRTEAFEASELSRRTAQIDIARGRFSDYDIVMAQPSAPGTAAPVLKDCVLARDRVAELAYWLTTHPEEDRRISAMVAMPDNATPRDRHFAAIKADRELDRIESEFLDLDTTPAAPPVAPPAPATVRTAPVAVAAAPKLQSLAPIKPQIPTPVGSRGTPGYKRLEHMSKAEADAIPLDEFRRRRDQGEGNSN